MPALLGALLLLGSLYRINNIWLLLITGLNPLIWIYSGRAYSEMLSLGLMAFAIVITKNAYLKAGLGLFSAVIKYNSFLFIVLHSGFIYMFQSFRNKKIYFNDQFKSILIISFGFLIFLLLYLNSFNVWIMPSNFRNDHFNSDILSFFTNFFSYGFFLAGMFFFTIPAFLNLEQIKIKVFLFVLSTILAIYNQNLGEMDFGSFQQFLGFEVILLIKIVGIWNFLLCCQAFWKDKESRIMPLTILGYIVLLSLTRPVNRYLIFVIPFWAILICQHISLSRLIWWVYVSILVGLNLFATLYQISNATASANMAEWAVQNDVRVSLGGIVYSHVGDFSHYDPNSNFIVSLAGTLTGEILHEESVTVFGFPIRSYVLTNITPIQIQD